MANYRDPSQVYETGSDDTFWSSKVIRDGDFADKSVLRRDQAGDLLDIEVDLSGIREASSEDEVMLALPPLSAVKASAKRCLEECDVKSMERFEGFARMPPDLFLAQCERGHEHELSKRLANHYRGLSMDVKLSLFRGWVASYGGQANNGDMSNYTAGQNHEPLEHEMAEYVELEVTLRSKTTFGTDKETIRVLDGQSAKDVAERVAQGYGAEVVEIRNPDGSIYEEALKVKDFPSPGM